MFNVLFDLSYSGSPLDYTSSARTTVSKSLFASELKDTGQVEHVRQYPPPHVMVERHRQISESSLDSTDRGECSNDISSKTREQKTK